MERLKRNDVVTEVSASWAMYGRVNRVFRDGTIEVICCGKNIKRDFPEAWQKVYYTGRSELVHNYKMDKNGYAMCDQEGNLIILASYPRFYPMPSLRKLKQMASRYNKKVWKKYRD